MEGLFEQQEKTTPEESGQPTQLNSSPLTLTENETVYDDEFVVRKTRFGLLRSMKVADSVGYVTGPDTEAGLNAVIYFTRQHLLREKDGKL